MLPELDSQGGRLPPIRIQVIVGGREAAENMSAEETEDGSPQRQVAKLQKA